jgi:hypothetical protein
MFRANMRERNEGRVYIDDISSSALKKMLAFMYTGEPPDLSESDDVIGLLGAAAKYEIEALQVKLNISKMSNKLLSIKEKKYIYFDKLFIFRQGISKNC